MIKFFVRTTGERTLDESFQQIEYKLLVDTEHNANKSFIDQLEYISKYDAVLLEDDIILCKDFKKRIKAVIKEYPDRVINFFTYPNSYFETRDSSNFVYNQCTYYPKGISKQIADKMKEIKTSRDISYDFLENISLRRLKQKHIQYRPCLVQHIDADSLMNHKTNYRRSPYFIDYLEELGISYKDADKYVEELTKLMNNKFKE